MCADAEVSSSCFAAERVVEDRLDSATNVLAASQQHRWRLLDDSLWTLRQHSEKPDPALAVLRTLFDQPRWVDPSYLYDDRGSDLFEEISQLPEYYLTRLEGGIPRILWPRRRGGQGFPASLPAWRTIPGKRRLHSIETE